MSFNSKDDVWSAVDLLIDDALNANTSKNNVSSAIIDQIPFFTCVNHFFTDSIRKDIERYIYCDQFKVPPYLGDYGQQPSKWVKRAFLIKNAIAKKESKDIEKIKAEQKAKANSKRR
tara:strand:+ start:2760 stop:3110 length:351 start_codon:yes stop_codon:yes gene_type:complete